MSVESTVSEKQEIDYSAMKNNLHYFTLCPNSEKPIKAVVICHLSLDMPAEGISNSLEDLGFNVINVRQMTAT
jgi:hypothetical protein